MDLTLEEGSHLRTEFFLSETGAKERSNQIIKEINDNGGEDNCDMTFKGGVGYFQYRHQNQLVLELDKLNEIYTT